MRALIVWTFPVSIAHNHDYLEIVFGPALIDRGRSRRRAFLLARARKEGGKEPRIGLSIQRRRREIQFGQAQGPQGMVDLRQSSRNV